MSFDPYNPSYDILGAGMLWKPKNTWKLLKFINIRAKECFDKVLNEEFQRILMCKMKNVITRLTIAFGTPTPKVGAHLWCAPKLFDRLKCESKLKIAEK